MFTVDLKRSKKDIKRNKNVYRYTRPSNTLPCFSLCIFRTTATLALLFISFFIRAFLCAWINATQSELQIKVKLNKKKGWNKEYVRLGRGEMKDENTYSRISKTTNMKCVLGLFLYCKCLTFFVFHLFQFFSHCFILAIYWWFGTFIHIVDSKPVYACIFTLHCSTYHIIELTIPNLIQSTLTALFFDP